MLVTWRFSPLFGGTVVERADATIEMPMESDPSGISEGVSMRDGDSAARGFKQPQNGSADHDGRTVPWPGQDRRCLGADRRGDKNRRAGDVGHNTNGDPNTEHAPCPMLRQHLAQEIGHEGFAEEVELLDYVEVLVHRRWLVICGAAACALIVALFTLWTPSTFYAQASILPAQQPDYVHLGPDLEGSGAQRGGFYVNMLRSIPVQRAVLTRNFQYERDGESVTTTLKEYFGAMTWRQATAALEGAVDVDTEKSGDITITARMASPGLAAAVPNALVDEVITAAQQRRLRHVDEQVAFIEQRVKEVQTQLAQSEQDLADFRRSNRDLSLSAGGEALLNPALVVEHSRLQRDVSLQSSVLSTLLNQREVARLEAKKQFPEVEVLARAERPEGPEGRGLQKRVILGGLVGLMASVMLAFILEYGKRSAAAGRMEPILADLRADGDRLRRMVGRAPRTPVA